MTWHEVQTVEARRKAHPGDQRPAAVIYSRSGRLALAVHLDPASEQLEALVERLTRQRYTVVSHVPLDSLLSWAAPDTPRQALVYARKILEGAA